MRYLRRMSDTAGSMPPIRERKLVAAARGWLALFMAGLVLSGLTAFPIETELAWAARHADRLPGPVADWLHRVHAAVADVNTRYPFLSYGTDWLAFSHLVIAVAFIGPLRDPVRNAWVIRFGLIACVMVFPLALGAGAVRGIPFCWRLIDCSFGVAGAVPLGFALRATNRLAREQVMH